MNYGTGIMTVSNSHSALYQLLLKSEHTGTTIKKEGILDATGWKESTFDTYWGKGQLSDFLSEINTGVYEATSVSRLSEVEFSKKLSQSKHRRGLGHNFKSRLARALLRKSRDNMLLALELYNRPSLENRLDGFALLFCAAWEQMLKAELIEKDGEESIYRKSSKKRGKIRETIPLSTCLDRVFSPKDKKRKNLERISFFRNEAAHLLMPEVQAVVSRLFQAGVLNYIEKFEILSEQRFLETSATGLLTLVGELRTPTIASLRSNYGAELGDEILKLVRTLEEEIRAEDNWQFAVPIDISVVFAKKGDGSALELVASTDEGIEGLRKAIVIEKAVDRKNTHPHKAKDVIAEVNRRLYERYDEQILEAHLQARDKIAGKPVINPYCLQAIYCKLKWRKADNKFHYASKNPEYHWYSEDAIEEIIEKIMSNPDFVANARNNYSNKRRRKKKGI